MDQLREYPFNFLATEISSGATHIIPMLRTDKANDGNALELVSLQMATDANLTTPVDASEFTITLLWDDGTEVNIMSQQVSATGGDITTDWVADEFKTITTKNAAGDRPVPDASDVRIKIVNAGADSALPKIYGVAKFKAVNPGA